MLAHLSIQNIVLIDRLTLDLTPGLTVLTGETGAGKSILLDALSLALGRRAETRLIRQGQDKAQVSASFTLNSAQQKALQKTADDLDIILEDELIIRRTLSKDGKSRAFLNDTPISAQALRIIGNGLIEIHGQFDTHGLFDARTHITLLDQFGDFENDLGHVKEKWDSYKSLLKERKTLQENFETAQRDREFLMASVEKLEKLAPQAGEEEELVAKRALFMNAEKLIEVVRTAQQAVGQDDGGRDRLHQALGALERQSDKGGDAFGATIDHLNRAVIEVDEAMSLLDGLLSDLDLDPTEQAHIDERLFALRGAARKYRVSVEELPDTLKNFQEKLDLLNNQTLSLDALNAQIDDTKKSYLESATVLHDKRCQVAQDLTQKVMAELSPLKLEKAQFVIRVTSADESQWHAHGISLVEFLVATNVGATPASLGKVASGGELARLMLALKVVLKTNIPTMIFDEVDTGIGGATADAVGQRLARLGDQAQVMVVTHSPQVAARGHHHLKISKTSDDQSTTTTVTPLNHSYRIEEIARMLAGADITSEARTAAQKLLDHNNALQKVE